MQATMGQQHGRESIISGPSLFDSLPVDCISSIISFTSPRDACVASCVSKMFESAAKSDTVWEKFLPSEYSSLIPQYSQVLLSKKELYFALCDDPVLIEDGQKSFWLEKESGKRCIMLSLTGGSITWGTSPQYWRWISIPESRFEKIAELRSVCWFEIGDGMHTRYLSPRTHYSVYIVFKTKNGCPNLGDSPVDAGVGLVGQESSQKLIYFIGPPGHGRGRRREPEPRDVTRPEAREDGWMEAELGEFYNDSCRDDISFTVVKINTPHWKSGLIIQGIEFRPAKIRFKEVPKLVTLCPFKINGAQKAKLLSPDTRYSAYVIYKAKDQIPDVQKSFGVGLIEHETLGKAVSNETREEERRMDGGKIWRILKPWRVHGRLASSFKALSSGL